MGNPGGSCPLEEGAPPKTVLLGYTFQCQLSQAISRSGTLSTVSPKTVLLGYTFQCQPSQAISRSGTLSTVSRMRDASPNVSEFENINQT